MKRLFFALAIVLGAISTFATAPELSSTPAEKIRNNDTFKEIPIEKLPQAIHDAFMADYKTATLNKAYVNEKQSYKLEFTVDGAASIVFADKDGNWIDKKI